MTMGLPGISQENSSVELSIQQGHSTSIKMITVSPHLNYIASVDENNKLIIWDYRSGSQMYFKYLPVAISGLEFTEEDYLINISGGGRNYQLNIQESFLSNGSQLITDFPLEAISESKIYKIKGAKLTVYDRQTQAKIKSKTADYFDQPFHSVVYSSRYKKTYAACEDGKIYVFNENLKLLKQLSGHLSGVNDLALTNDQQYLFSASSDRSIIKWDLPTEKQVDRMSGKSFPTFGISINKEEDKLIFGDEIGNIREIDLGSTRLDLRVEKHSIYPVTATMQLDDGTTVLGGKFNNVILKNGEEENILHIRKNSSPLMMNHWLFTQALDIYKPPYAGLNAVLASPSQNRLLIASDINGWGFEYLRVYDRKTDSYSNKLFHLNTNDIINAVFADENSIVSLKSETQLIVWKLSNDLQDVEQKFIPLEQKFVSMARYNEHSVVLLDEYGKLYICNITTNAIASLGEGSYSNVFEIGNGNIALIDRSFQINVASVENNSLEIKAVLNGHQDGVTSVAYGQKSNRLFSTSKDATVKIWDIARAELLVTIVPIGQNNAIYVTPDNYYMMTGKELSSFGFKVKGDFVFPEQFDPKYNRPDIVLDRLGYADDNLIEAYRKAYIKRLKKLNFSEEMLQADFHLPELEVAVSTVTNSVVNSESLNFQISAIDSKYPIDRLNVWINDVAIFGANGINLRDLSINEYKNSLDIPLAKGENKIDFTIMNQAGAESFKETFVYQNSFGPEKSELYLVTIGESEFQNSNYNLTYAAKDAQDLVNLFKQSKRFKEVHTKMLLNNEVTRKNVLSIKDFLKNASINDEVIIFFAGHGLLDDQLDYYFASYDMNFSNPSEGGIAYGDIEGLLDQILPLKKILLIDACHSGEIDKEEVALVSSTQVEDGEIQFRAVGDDVIPKIGVENISELTKSLFTDLRKGTGATVISSAGGMEYAIESSKWKNGLFTYSLINGIKSKDADLNKDKNISLKELQQYVGEQVNKLSKGKQKPTTRIENRAIDYRIW